VHLNRGVEYGIEGLLYLARNGKGRITLLREVSHATSIPETFLSKIFQRLVRSGLICSRRGFRGGFHLARPASQITLRDVIEALQGPISPPGPESAAGSGGFGSRARGALQEVLREAQTRVRKIFEETTVADLIASGFGPSAESNL
jgi:Rrf2 family transcriptional regulator, iron-sulfur cluster assembly transcription factor